MPEKKPTRRYTSRLRDQQAAATRERVVRAAAELFAANGYAATSLPQIARRADVSTETVQAHGPKAQLLRAAVDVLAFGSGPGTSVLDTPLGSRFYDTSSPEDAARTTAEVLTEVNRATHGLWLAFSEAARTDETVAEEFTTLALGIRAEGQVVQRLWRERGWLRDDVPDETLAQWGDVIGSVEIYDRVVRVERTDEAEYTALIATLLLELMAKR